MKILTLTILLVTVSFSCAQKRTNICEIINIENNLKSFERINLTEFTDSISYINLETTDQSLLSEISNIDIRNNLILILDNRGNCVLFNEDGKFISKIGKKGNGPGEYLFPSIAKLGENEIIYILSLNKIYVYNLRGEFLQDLVIPYNILSSWLNNSLLATSDTTFLLQVPNYSDSTQSKLIEFNTNGSIIKTYGKKQSLRSIGASTIHTRSNVYIYNDEISFKEVLNDTIFRIRNSEISPEYILNFGIYSLPGEASKSDPKEFSDLLSRSIILYNFVESLNYIFLQLSFGKNSSKEFDKDKIINNEIIKVGYPVLGIYNKLDKTLRFSKPSGYRDELNYTGLYNDLDGGLNVFPLQRIDDSSFISWVNPFELKLHTSSFEFLNRKVKNQENKYQLLKQSQNLSPNDNPILVKIKIKNHRGSN
jgi:hypothetical protein